MQNIYIGGLLSLNTILCASCTFFKLQKVSDFVIILGSVYSADMFSGLLHIYFDKKKIKFVNKNDPGAILVHDKYVTTLFDKVAHGFQIHHDKPRSFIDQVPWYNPVGQYEILRYLSIPTYTMTLIFDIYYNGLLSKNYKNIFIFMYSFNMIATFSQILHGFSHRTKREIPLFIQILQNYGIIINTHKHHLHHTSYNTNFSIVNGWSNGVLNILYKRIISPTLSKFSSHFDIEQK